MRPALHDDSIGALTHLLYDPVARLLRSVGAGYAWTERHLRRSVPDHGLAVEFARPGAGFTVARPAAEQDSQR